MIRFVHQVRGHRHQHRERKEGRDADGHGRPVLRDLRERAPRKGAEFGVLVPRPQQRRAAKDERPERTQEQQAPQRELRMRRVSQDDAFGRPWRRAERTRLPQHERCDEQTGREQQGQRADGDHVIREAH